MTHRDPSMPLKFDITTMFGSAEITVMWQCYQSQLPLCTQYVLWHLNLLLGVLDNLGESLVCIASVLCQNS